MNKTLRSFWWSLPLLVLVSHITSAQVTYIWNGSRNNQWTNALNWTPSRTSPQPTDNIMFNVGRSAIISEVPAQTVGTLIVTNNTSVELQAGSAINFDITNLLEVNAGSFIGFSSNGNVINVTTSETKMLGTITMHSGDFTINGSLTLQGALTKVNGKYLLGATSSLNLGSGGNSSLIQLPDDVFVAPVSIAKLTINNANGVSLGNQSITVNNSLVLTKGVLNANSSGRIIVSPTATIPLESTESYIRGYVELLPKFVGTSALNFMGLNLAAGTDDIGNVSVLRKTGPTGANFFSGKQSIAVNWKITADVQPSSGRNLNFSWISANDNTHNAALRFQIYRFGASSFWQPVGGLMPLASNISGVRTTATVTTTEFSEWTASDENSPLPVQWLSFNGFAHEQGIQLKWQTASEENTDFFEVEKLNRDSKFSVIGNLMAAGNSKVVQRYEFTDDEAATGVNYYRIKQVDLDGQFSYSKIINVSAGPTKTDMYSIYPVPAQTFLSVKRNSMFIHNETLTLFDQFGKMVYSEQLSADNITTVNNLQIPAGMYRLEITGEGTYYNRKIVVK